MSQPTKTATTRRSPSANGTEGSRGSKRTARGLADVRFQEILNALLAAEFQTQPRLPQNALKRDSISMKRRGGGADHPLEFAAFALTFVRANKSRGGKARGALHMLKQKMT